MTFKKPYRICNTPVMIPERAEGKANCITAALKELKNRYELRIGIPGARKHNLAVYIAGGTLYVYENQETMTETNTVLGYFLLPANVQQDEVKAFYRSYGLKIVMPVCLPDGKVLHIPVLQD